MDGDANQVVLGAVPSSGTAKMRSFCDANSELLGAEHPARSPSGELDVQRAPRASPDEGLSLVQGQPK